MHDEHYLTVYGRSGTASRSSRRARSWAERAGAAPARPARTRGTGFHVVPFMEMFVGDYRTRAGAARRRGARAPHRLRQRRQPAAGARRRPRAGGGDPRRPRRRPRADRPPAPHRERRARARLRRRRAALARGASALSSPWRPPACRGSSRRARRVVLAFTLAHRAREQPVFGLAPALRAAARPRARSRRAGAAPACAAAATGCAPSDRRRGGARPAPPGRRRPAHPLRAGAAARPARVRSRRVHGAALAPRRRVRGTRPRADVRAARRGGGQIPGVAPAAVTTRCRCRPAATATACCPKGRPSLGTRSSSRLRIVTPGYFQTMGIPIVVGGPRGRRPAGRAKR